MEEKGENAPHASLHDPSTRRLVPACSGNLPSGDGRGRNGPRAKREDEEGDEIGSHGRRREEGEEKRSLAEWRKREERRGGRWGG